MANPSTWSRENIVERKRLRPALPPSSVPQLHDSRRSHAAQLAKNTTQKDSPSLNVLTGDMSEVSLGKKPQQPALSTPAESSTSSKNATKAGGTGFEISESLVRNAFADWEGPYQSGISTGEVTPGSSERGISTEEDRPAAGLAVSPFPQAQTTRTKLNPEATPFSAPQLFNPFEGPMYINQRYFYARTGGPEYQKRMFPDRQSQPRPLLHFGIEDFQFSFSRPQPVSASCSVDIDKFSFSPFFRRPDMVECTTCTTQSPRDELPQTPQTCQHERSTCKSCWAGKSGSNNRSRKSPSIRSAVLSVTPSSSSMMSRHWLHRKFLTGKYH